MIATAERQIEPINSFADSPRVDIECEQSFGGGSRFALPYRELQEARRIGWLGVGVGAFVVLFMVGWIAGPLAIGVGLLMKNQLFGLLPIAFSFLGIPGLRYAMLLMAGGLAVTKDRSRTVVIVESGKLQAVEEFFRFKWRRKCKLPQIKKLVVADRLEDDETDEVNSNFLGSHDQALVAHSNDGKRFPVAIGYPRDVLLKLAENIARELDVATVAEERIALSSRRAPAVEVAEDSSFDKIASVPIPPDDSDAVLTSHETGIKIEIPPVGLKGSSAFFFFFGVVWLAITNMIVFAIIADIPGDMQEVWITAALLTCFELVGFGMLYSGFNGAKRRTALVTSGDQLMVVSESLFSKRRKTWAASEIRDIGIGNSGVEINDRPVRELQIHGHDRKKFGCLSERPDNEIRWFAAELRKALGIEAPTSRNGAFQPTDLPTDVEGRFIPAANSSASVSHQAEQTQVRIPAQGIRSMAPWIATGGIMQLVSVGICFFFLLSMDSLAVLIPLAFVLLFFAMGLGIMVFGYVLADRSYLFEVTPWSLRIERGGFMSRKTYDYKRDEIQRVAIVDSGTKVNHRKLKQLRVRTSRSTSRATFQGMTGHSDEDLSLVVQSVNQVLQPRENQSA